MSRAATARPTVRDSSTVPRGIVQSFDACAAVVEESYAPPVDTCDATLEQTLRDSLAQLARESRDVRKGYRRAKRQGHVRDIERETDEEIRDAMRGSTLRG